MAANVAVSSRFVAHRRAPSSSPEAASTLSTTPSSQRGKGSGTRLTDATRLEILALLAAPAPSSLRQLARQFGVSETTIRHVRDRAAAITSRALAISEGERLRTRRAVQKTFPELEARLGEWLDTHTRVTSTGDSDGVNIAKSSALAAAVTSRAEEIAVQLGLREHEFRASASWLKDFQRRRTAAAAARDALWAADEPLAIPTKRKRGAGPRLSDGQRLEILQLLQQENRLSNRKLARHFSVDEATIRHVKANAAAIQQRARSAPIDVRQTTFRGGHAKFAELEAILADWIDASRRCNAEIPIGVVRRKAEEVARALALPAGAFKASLQWYAAFCRRRGIGPVAPIDDLEAVVAAYDAADVFTVDETGLFYCLLPRHATLVPSMYLSGSDAAESHERVSLVLCCNAAGTERLPVTMIAKHAAPRCKALSSDWPLPYFHQRSAWLDATVFARWFDEVFAPHVGRARSVLLLLDDAPGHPMSFVKDNIRVLALHPASKAWTPPLAAGVIAGLKTRYKLRVLSDILAHHALPSDIKQTLAQSSRHTMAGVFFGKMPHLLDAAHRLADAWAELSPSLLRVSFAAAGFVPQLSSDAVGGSSGGGAHELATRVEAEERAVEAQMLEMLRSFSEAQRRASSERDDTAAALCDETLADDLQTYLHLDDDSSTVYQQCIMDDVDRAHADSEDTVETETEDDAGEDTAAATVDTGTAPSTTMLRILNDTSQPTAVASAQEVLATSTLLGLQLRQLQASSAFDAQQIESAVLMVDRLRRELQAAATATAGTAHESRCVVTSDNSD